MAAFSLPKDLTMRIATLATDMEDFVAEQREEFYARSDRWQESEAGVSAEAWLEQADDLAEMLEQFPQSSKEV
ncbi:hypothetical protein [Amycolatopsis thermoflava]|uniref:hypothetical protein n=1 Tax=Amycolatopsis thermoflava TaxID=84480 RepID=UPI003F4A4DB8